jgi:lipid II isoglutaminyl synthase (glutamine-hydrolysing)
MFLSIQVFLFLILSKILSITSRVLKKGSGTALPGYFVENYFPTILRYFDKKYKNVIYISGTNGKTTTRAILVDLIEKNNLKVLTNKGGANIMRGLASALFTDLGLNLKVKSDILVLEVEEATLPKISKFIKVDTLILTNVFRDQLDAYGEIDKTLEYFKLFLKDQECIVILNGDDPKLLEIVPSLNNKKIEYCGVISEENPQYEGSLAKLVKFNYQATNIGYNKGLMTFNINEQPYTTQLSGVYNIYNITFALAVANNLNLKQIPDYIRGFKPVFGRGERFDINNNLTSLFLVKNPEGFNQVLQYIKKAYVGEKLNLFFLINDNIADSRDVSWLWDVEFEKFRELFLTNGINIESLYVGGSRGDDILLRLEYADFHSITYGNNLGSIKSVVDNIVKLDSTNIVFATYTAMLEFRKELALHIDVSDITAKGS